MILFNNLLWTSEFSVIILLICVQVLDCNILLCVIIICTLLYPLYYVTVTCNQAILLHDF